MRCCQLILVALVGILAWKYLDGSFVKRAIKLFLITTLVTGLSVVPTGTILVEIPLGSNPVIFHSPVMRVMPPTTFPFTMQQYRDYDLNQFYYRIVIGWPDGIPIYEGGPMDDQSEYIHLAHLQTTILLGAYVFVGQLAILALIYIHHLRKQARGIQDSTEGPRVDLPVQSLCSGQCLTNI